MIKLIMKKKRYITKRSAKHYRKRKLIFCLKKDIIVSFFEGFYSHWILIFVSYLKKYIKLLSGHSVQASLREFALRNLFVVVDDFAHFLFVAFRLN